uniref:Enhancer of mRNA-decapping protein 4 n=1 Tax=Phallusia mammillata TaxID=59560 RepID=A0A6F9DAW6_9ASCI|nr:enhancer of mRNA-decapping protein 4-like [Phallusia mammillata]
MSSVNGSSGEGSHRDMANTLKEMLKINSSPADSVLQTNHVGSGDGLPTDPLPNTEENTCSAAGDTSSNDQNNSDHQTIFMKDLEDGQSAFLHGKETTIVASPQSEIDSEVPASNKVKVNTITKFDWEHKYYTGSLISVTDTYIAYSIKGHTAHSVRVINRHNSSDRVLLKGFTGVVCDVAFSSPCSNTVAAVDSFGNLIVWQLNELSGNIVAERMIHIEAETTGTSSESSTYRVVWIPCVNFDSKGSSIDEGGNSFGDSTKNDDSDTQKLLALSYGNIAEVWDLDSAFVVAKSNEKVQRSQLPQVFVTFDDHQADISDCELSPIGNVLATACYDGYVKFWQIDIEDTAPPACLHSWKPHGGNPVSAVKFVDNKQKPALSVYWRFLLTGCDRNSELKLWCAISWDCLQLIKFAPSSPAHALPELNLVLNLSADYVVLTDINRKVLYVMQMQNVQDETAQVASVAQFQLKSPLLSVAFVDAKLCKFKNVPNGVEEIVEKAKVLDESFDEEEDEHKSQDETEEPTDVKKLDGVLIKLLAIQSKSLQSLDVRFISNESGANEGGISHDTLSTYNTISDDIKDTVSLSSADENLFQPSKSEDLPEQEPVVSVNGSLSDLIASHSFNLMESHEYKPDFQEERKDSNHDDTIVANQTPTSPEASIPLHSLPHSSTQEKSVAPDLTRSVSPSPQQPPVLLTPDAFMAPMKSPNNPVQSTNTSFTAVTPYSNREESYYQPSQDLLLGSMSRNPLSNMVLSPSTIASEVPPMMIPPEADDPATPPSSPVLPRASSSPARADPLPVARTRSVKSPDLISSTSTQDGDQNKELNDLASNNQPSLSHSHSSLLSMGFAASASGSGSHVSSAPMDSFPPILMQTSSGGQTGTSWPKAPDVTMSRSMSSRSPPGGSMQINLEPSVQQEIPPQQVDEVQQPIEPRPALDVQELVRILTELRHQQRDLLNDHQRELQTITKKQSQVQKQNDTSLKRSEQQGDRLEKSLKSVSENQRRMLNDMKAMQTGVTEATANKIGRVIKTEIKQSVLPGLAGSLEPIKEQLSQSVVQKLTATDHVMKENIAKLVKSKEMVDSIAASTAKSLHGQIVSSLPEILFNAVVPPVERSSQAMFQQLAETYNRGMQELVAKMEKQLQYRLKPEQDRLQNLIKESFDATSQLQAASKRLSSDVANVLQKQIPAEVEKSLTRCEERITNSVLEAVKKQQQSAFAEQTKAIGDVVRGIVTATLDDKLAASGDSSTLAPGTSPVAGALGSRPQSRANILDQQQQILKLLQQGNVNTAFQTALTASDLNLVMYVCETVDPSVVFGVTPCPLQQPILLSLIQQLSSDLTTKTEIKWKYLQEAVMNLDRRHQVTQEYMHSVLSALVQKLQTCAQGPLETPSLAKDLKMLSMAAQSLMK